MSPIQVSDAIAPTNGEWLTTRWWEESGDDLARRLFSTVYEIDKNSSGLSQTNLRCLRMYLNRDLQDLSVSNFVYSTSPDYTGTFGLGQFPARPTRVHLNVAKSAVDTLVSKIGKNKVKPVFLTSGGTLQQRTRGKQLNKFLYGIMDETKSHRIYRVILRDMCIFGTAFLKSYKDDKGRIRKERVFPDEILVDPADAYYGSPACLYHRRFVSKYALLASKMAKNDPKLQEKIRSLPTIDIRFQAVVEPCVLVVEAWRLPRAGQPGKHVLIAKNCVLSEEEYKREKFPFAVAHFDSPLLGFWGSGLCEEVAGLQTELNRITNHMQECLRLMAYPRIFYQKGSQIDKGKFVNDIGTFVPYTGSQPPIVSVAPAIGSEVFQWWQEIYQKTFEMPGVSQLAAQGKKPSGLDSGRALREYSDIQSERFAVLQQQWEEFVIDDAYQTIDLMDDDYVVSYASRENGLEEIKWSDVKLPRDNFLIQCFSSSALPNTPSARLQLVTEMKNEGYIEPELAAELLDFPDIEGPTAMKLAPLRLILESLERALLDGEYVKPEPFFPPDLALKWAQSAYCWAKLKKIPEKHCNLVLDWIQDVLAFSQPPLAMAESPAQTLQNAQLAAISQAPAGTATGPTAGPQAFQTPQF